MKNDDKEHQNNSQAKNDVNSMIENKNIKVDDEFFERKFNLKLSTNKTPTLKKSTDILDDMKKRDQMKLKKYMADDDL